MVKYFNSQLSDKLDVANFCVFVKCSFPLFEKYAVLFMSAFPLDLFALVFVYTANYKSLFS